VVVLLMPLPGQEGGDTNVIDDVKLDIPQRHETVDGPSGMMHLLRSFL